MGLLDSIRDRVSSTVTQAKQAVSETVTKVEDKAVSAGHAVGSAFEAKPSAPRPPPAAPPPTASAPVVSSSPVFLKGALTASISDSVKAPPPSSETQAAAKALISQHTSWKGLNEEALGHDLAELAKKDPAAAAPTLREVMIQLGRTDRDDVADAFAGEMSSEQLRAVAQHPDGKEALASMQHELKTGYTSGHEAKMAELIGGALNDAATKPLPHVAVDMANGARGVNQANTRTTPTGRIPAEAWADPSKLVADLTQNPSAGSNGAGNTCFPSTVLAATLMASPEKAARMMDTVAKSEEVHTLLPAERNELLAISSRVRNKTATYEDLGKAQQLLFRAGNTQGDASLLGKLLRARGMNGSEFKNLTPAEGTEFRAILAQDTPWSDTQAKRIEELFTRSTGVQMHMAKDETGTYAPKIEGDLVPLDDSGFSDEEAKKFSKLAGLTGKTEVTNADLLKDLAAKLKNGESVSLRVAGTPDGDVSNHFITVGRREDGTLFLYNPDPANKDATLTIGGKGAGTPEFQKLLQDYQDRQPGDPNGKPPQYVPYRLD